jgi:hypothetical protein
LQEDFVMASAIESVLRIYRDVDIVLLEPNVQQVGSVLNTTLESSSQL